MKETILANMTWLLAFVLLVQGQTLCVADGAQPVADAGSSRYAAQDPVVLDGTGSYSPDYSGPLSYAWRQIAGQTVAMSDGNSATPVVGGFVQTSEIQECRFELVVSKGDNVSLPDTVKVIIVPSFSGTTTFPSFPGIRIVLANESFDPNKPTIIYFGGANSTADGNGLPQYGRAPWNSPVWSLKANLLSFPDGYPRDAGPVGSRSYHRIGDAIITYLSTVAPDYCQPIQTMGWSAGGRPTLDVGTYLNQAFHDPRYAINHVTFIDAVDDSEEARWRTSDFLNSAVDGEQCWMDNYVSFFDVFPRNMLNIGFEGTAHELPRDWYGNSLTMTTASQFNGGVVGGAYWSVIGPGKNLQLVSASDTTQYVFNWHGSASSGHIDFYSESKYPGRLPEPVTLVGPADGAAVDANGAVLSCEVSENAVGYQLLFGSDPYRVMDYIVVSDTPLPPNEVTTTFPFEKTWWTVKVRDQFGSTIYADPILIYAQNVVPPAQETVHNVTIGKGYDSIQRAIDEAVPGDEIVVDKGIFFESIDFKGKSLTLRSTDPNDSSAPESTIINGIGDAVTFSGGEDEGCMLAGFTIRDAETGIYCSDASPTIDNCYITGNSGAGVELHMGSNPAFTNCIIAGNHGAGIEMWPEQLGRATIFNYPTMTNCTVAKNLQHGISGGIPTIANSIIWDNSAQEISDTVDAASVTHSNIQGGFFGEGNIDTNPVFADPDNGDYHLKSEAGRWCIATQTWKTDDLTSPCVDAGDPNFPMGDEQLPNGDRINMGAYGGTFEASKSSQSLL